MLAGLVPLGQLADATSIGTLFAFAVVNVGVIVLRRTRPDLPRSFRTPFFPRHTDPGRGVLPSPDDQARPASTWVAFCVWMAVGLIAYFLYGFRHSRLNRSVR